MSGAADAHNADQSSPNILFIIADDLGIGDLGCYGNQVVDTPVIDSLAAGGVRFTQHYAPSPLCAPSRAGFLTGRFNHRTGAVDVPSNRGLDRIALSHKTFGNYFQNAGYATALIGKWHNGLYCKDYLPDRRGFDLFFGFPNGGQDYYKWNLLRNKAQQPSQHVPFDGRYLTDVLNDEACAFISSSAKQNKPVALFLAHHVPHVPFQAPERLIEKYRQKLQTANSGDPAAQENVAIIYAMIEAMDTGLGKVFQTLKQRKLWHNTVIVFTSDNGAWLGRYKGQTTQRFHAGLSGNKGDVGEQGIRVPAIISWPGHIDAAQVIDTPIHGCDWLPTLLSVTDTQRRPDQAQQRSGNSRLVESNRSKQRAQRNTFPCDECHSSFPLFASVKIDSTFDGINLTQQRRPDQTQRRSGNTDVVELNRRQQRAQRNTSPCDECDSSFPLFPSVKTDSAFDGINLTQQSRPDQTQRRSGNSEMVELNRSKQRTQRTQRSTCPCDQCDSSFPSFASVKFDSACDGINLTEQRRPDQAQRRSGNTDVVELNRSKQRAQRSTFPCDECDSSFPSFASVKIDSACDGINLTQQRRPDQAQRRPGNSRLVELNRSKQRTQRNTFPCDECHSSFPLFASVKIDSTFDGINLTQQRRPDQTQRRSGNSDVKIAKAMPEHRHWVPRSSLRISEPDNAEMVELNRSQQRAQRSTFPCDECDSSFPSFASVEIDSAFDGINLMPLLMGRPMPELDVRQLPFQKNRYRPAAHSDAAIRQGRWKLMWPGVAVTMKKDSARDNPSYLKGLTEPHWEMRLDTQLDPVPRFQDPKPELFDLLTDPAEQNDVSADHPELVNRLSTSYNAWFKDVMKDWRKSRKAIVEHDKAWWQDKPASQ